MKKKIVLNALIIKKKLLKNFQSKKFEKTKNTADKRALLVRVQRDFLDDEEIRSFETFFMQKFRVLLMSQHHNVPTDNHLNHPECEPSIHLTLSLFAVFLLQ